MNVLVTGGAGYIGAHTCKALHERGHTPVVYDNLSLGSREFVKWGPFVCGDTRDTAAVAAALERHGVDAVIHFAALSSVGESVTAPESYYSNNVGGLLGVLSAMRQTGCAQLVFSSTAAVYGDQGPDPLPETASALPINAYGRSKRMCEEILGDFDSAYGVRSISLRYFNASGADPGAEIGEFRKAETHLIPRVMMALQGHIDDFEVYGSDFPTPDGTAVRDYIHVSDLADAHVVALEKLRDGSESAIFNAGTGQGHSVAQVLDQIARTTGRSLAAPRGERRPGDPVRLVADASLARRVLQFSPTRSDLATIIETAWRWHQAAHPAVERRPESQSVGRLPAVADQKVPIRYGTVEPHPHR